MANKISGFKDVRKAIALLLALCAFPALVFGADEGGKFDAGTMIIEHVSDAHSWHIAGKTAIPLPIILYSSNRGFSVFSSSRLEDGAIYNNYKFNGEHIVAVNADGSINQADTAKIYDISITKNAATILLAGFLLLLTFFAVAKGYLVNGTASAPKGIQSLMEPVILFIRDDIAIPSIGKDKHGKYMAYLLTLFFFIIFLNLLGLMPFFPGGANVTGNIAITTTLACITFLIMILNSTKTYWAHTLWMPGVPAAVKILILTPIEILGVVLKPFTLLIRIFANMLAGHIVVLSFFSLIFIFGAMSKAVGYGVSAFSVAFSAGMLLLDVLVAFIQAYVFTLLSAIYFGMVTAEDEHH